MIMSLLLKNSCLGNHATGAATCNCLAQKADAVKIRPIPIVGNGSSVGKQKGWNLLPQQKRA